MKRDPLKIALIHQPLGPIWTPGTSASIGLWVYEVAQRLARRCDVTVYARKGKGQPTVEDHEGVHYRRVSVTPDRILHGILSPLSRLRTHRRPFFASRLNYLSYIVRIARDLQKRDCDIVHVQVYSQFVPIIRAFNPHVKIVLHMHNEWLSQLDRPMIARRLHYVDYVAGCSRYVTDTIRVAFPELAQRSCTLLDGVDIRHFCADNGHPSAAENPAPRLLFVGRITPEKGLHILLEAFAKVLNVYPGARLDLVGPAWVSPPDFGINLSDDPKVRELKAFYRGSYLSHLRSAVPTHLWSQVTLHGLVPNRDLVKYYREADIFINPTFTESLGMSTLEALATGLPVVSTRVGGVPETIEDGKTGLLVGSGDPHALAAAIVRLLGDKDLRASLGQAAARRARQIFSWETIAADVYRLYEEIGCTGN